MTTIEEAATRRTGDRSRGSTATGTEMDIDTELDSNDKDEGRGGEVKGLIRGGTRGPSQKKECPKGEKEERRTGKDWSPRDWGEARQPDRGTCMLQQRWQE